MRFAIIGAGVFAATIGVAARHAPAQLPQTYTNLQVLPKDITPKALVDVMRSFAIELGTRCEHCHVGEGNDLSTFNFASDAKPEKATARTMLHMVTALQSQYLKDVGDPTSRPKVTCYTCHRGALKPLTAPPGGGAAPR